MFGGDDYAQRKALHDKILAQRALQTQGLMPPVPAPEPQPSPVQSGIQKSRIGRSPVDKYLAPTEPVDERVTAGTETVTEKKAPLPAMEIPQKFQDLQAGKAPQEEAALPELATKSVIPTTPEGIAKDAAAYQQKKMGEMVKAREDEQNLLLADAAYAREELATAEQIRLQDETMRNKKAMDHMATMRKNYDDLAETTNQMIKAHNASTIDPNRALAGFGNKVLGAVSLFLGGFAQAFGGQNTGMVLIQDALKRDLDAQLAAREKGHQAITAYQRHLDDLRERFVDEKSFRDYALAERNMLFAETIKPLIQRIQAPALRAQAEAENQRNYLANAKVASEINKNNADSQAKLTGAQTERYKVMTHNEQEWAKLNLDAQRLAMDKEAAAWARMKATMDQTNQWGLFPGYEYTKEARAKGLLLDDTSKRDVRDLSIGYEQFLMVKQKIIDLLKSSNAFQRRFKGSEAHAKLKSLIFDLSTAAGKAAATGVIGQVERIQLLETLGGIYSGEPSMSPYNVALNAEAALKSFMDTTKQKNQLALKQYGVERVGGERIGRYQETTRDERLEGAEPTIRGEGAIQ